jgi:hypothetical protein
MDIEIQIGHFHAGFRDKTSLTKIPLHKNFSSLSLRQNTSVRLNHRYLMSKLVFPVQTLLPGIV